MNIKGKNIIFLSSHFVIHALDIRIVLYIKKLIFFLFFSYVLSAFAIKLQLKITRLTNDKEKREREREKDRSVQTNKKELVSKDIFIINFLFASSIFSSFLF